MADSQRGSTDKRDKPAQVKRSRSHGPPPVQGNAPPGLDGEHDDVPGFGGVDAMLLSVIAGLIVIVISLLTLLLRTRVGLHRAQLRLSIALGVGTAVLMMCVLLGIQLTLAIRRNHTDDKRSAHMGHNKGDGKSEDARELKRRHEPDPPRAKQQPSPETRYRIQGFLYEQVPGKPDLLRPVSGAQGKFEGAFKEIEDAYMKFEGVFIKLLNAPLDNRNSAGGASGHPAPGTPPHGGFTPNQESGQRPPGYSPIHQIAPGKYEKVGSVPPPNASPTPIAKIDPLGAQGPTANPAEGPAPSGAGAAQQGTPQSEQRSTADAGAGTPSPSSGQSPHANDGDRSGAQANIAGRPELPPIPPATAAQPAAPSAASPPQRPPALVASPKPIAKIEPVDPTTLEKLDPPGYAGEKKEYPHEKYDYWPRSVPAATASPSATAPAAAQPKLKPRFGMPWGKHQDPIDEPTVVLPGRQEGLRGDGLSLAGEGWRIVGASRRGLGHEIKGKFREDDFEFTVVDDRLAIIAIADGVGSKELSRYGARAAVLGAIKAARDSAREADIARFFDDLARDPTAAVTRGRAEDLLKPILHGAREAVQKKAGWVEKTDDDLHATLLLYLAAPCRLANSTGLFVASVMIGDGALFAGGLGSAASWQYVQEPQVGGGNNAVQPFLRSSPQDWRRSFFADTFATPMVMGMTDGIDDDIAVSAQGNRHVPEVGQFLDAFGIAAALAAPGSPKSTAEALLKALEYRKRQSFDDRTLVCIYRLPTSEGGYHS